MKFDYILHEGGWATANISCGDLTAEMAVSYLHDTLDDLSDAVLAIMDGAREAAAIFMDEPGEHRLVIRRVSETDVALELRWYKDWASWGLGSCEYEIVLCCSTRIVHLRGQVLSALKALLDEHGAAGYKERWVEHDFPFERLRQLQAAS